MASIQEARTKLVISTTTQTVNQTLIAEDTVNKVVSITAASLSIVGTMVIISTFVMWPDLRTTSRKIVVFISVGDFLVAASNITGELNQNLSVCRIQAAIGIFAVLPSFFWTVYLSFYFYLTICRKIAVESENRFMMFFHITAWGIPLIIAVLAVILKGAGHSGDFVSSGWCWISDNQSCWKVVLWMFVAGKGWELLAYISITAFYVLVKLHIRREVGEGFTSSSTFLTLEALEVVKKADRKLTFIPVVFILLRIWGTIRFIRFLACLPECLLKGPRPAIKSLIILQGIGDSSQGFANFVLFCLFTDKIRKKFRICCSHYMPFCCRHPEKLDPLCQSTNYGTF